MRNFETSLRAVCMCAYSPTVPLMKVCLRGEARQLPAGRGETIQAACHPSICRRRGRPAGETVARY
jgi:hypothetical protein